MSNETVITMVGNLTADPELRTTPNGGTVANFTIASTARVFNRNSQQWEDGDALFLRCSAWDSQYSRLASNIQASLAKGMRVIARGDLVQRSYTDREGNNRTAVELKVNEIGTALTKATAQVTKENTGDSGQWNGKQQQPQSSYQQAPPRASQQSDPWGGESDEPAF
jgi:single-strand DNA-binding protein